MKRHLSSVKDSFSLQKNNPLFVKKQKREQQDQKTGLTNLNQDCLFQLFHFLDVKDHGNLSSVSETMYNNISDFRKNSVTSLAIPNNFDPFPILKLHKKFWTTNKQNYSDYSPLKELTFGDFALSEKIISYVVQSFPHLEVLNLDKCKNIVRNLFGNIRNLPNLRTLSFANHFNNSNIDMDDIQFVKDMNLESFSFYSDTSSNKIIRYIVEMPIDYLSINSHFIGNDDLKILVKKPLKSLSLKTNGTDACFSYLKEMPLEELFIDESIFINNALLNLKEIKTLKKLHLDYRDDDENIGDLFNMNQIVDNLCQLNLESLTLGVFIPISNEHLKSLLNNLTKLKSLTVSMGKNLSPFCFKNLKLRNLDYLKIKHFTDIHDANNIELSTKEEVVQFLDSF